MKDMHANKEVFDVANWLDRATGRTAAPVRTLAGSAGPSTYAPRHRSHAPVDSVA